MKTLLVTGGAGFIGSALVRHLVAEGDWTVVNLDKLTYAGNPDSLPGLMDHPRHRFEQVDICDAREVERVFREHRPDAVMHLAAESHVDRSIDGPADFIQTNVVGTSVLLEAARSYWKQLKGAAKEGFRFHHVSTDEVYGSLGPEGLFTEESPYQPSSPYSASKASSDHLVRAWHETYGLPVLITNCSNNYGPYQFPEKLIPLMILNALAGKPLPIYGKGDQVRDWLYVDDHVRALLRVLESGRRYRLKSPTKPSSPMSPTARATTSATPSMPARSSASWAGCRRRPSTPGWKRPSSGISTTTAGAGGCWTAATGASAWG